MSGTINQWPVGAPVLMEGWQWIAGTNPNGASVFTAPGAGRIIAIMAYLGAAETGTATLTPVRVPSGSTVAQGVQLCPALNTGAGATINTAIHLETGTPGGLRLNPGDTVGFQATGMGTASAGSVSFYWVAQ